METLSHLSYTPVLGVHRHITLKGSVTFLSCSLLTTLALTTAGFWGGQHLQLEELRGPMTPVLLELRGLLGCGISAL